MHILTLRRALALTVAMIALLPELYARDYNFDGRISRQVLENYLSRSITFAELLNIERVENSLGGDTDDNIRMLTGIGAKFIGRAIYMWGAEDRLPRLLELGKTSACTSSGVMTKSAGSPTNPSNTETSGSCTPGTGSEEPTLTATSRCPAIVQAKSSTSGWRLLPANQHMIRRSATRFLVL